MSVGWFAYGPVEPRPIGRAGEAVAGALADAFLAAAWRRPDLVAAGARVVGARRRFLHAVVRVVLDGYPRAPVDRPRELAAFVAATAEFRAALLLARRRRRPIRVHERPVVPVRTARRPWRTPVVDDLGALAELLGLSIVELDWFADRRSINRHAADRALRHYWPVWVGYRLIEAPKPRLRALQRGLLAELFARIPVHGAAHGFVPGRSVRTFAEPHAGRRMVVRLDLVSFFASVTAGRVYGLLRTAGYPEPVAHALTGLCTTATPHTALRRAPPGLPDRRYRLALLARPHLPQGAPTSPVLANLCGYRLDRRLAGLAAAFDARYTRYADDLAFSGGLDARQAAALASRVASVAAEEGFRVHPAKTRVRGRADRQLLAGLVVNARPMVPRHEYDRLRAVLHNAARTGLDEQNREGLLDFADRLAGRVEWAGQGSAARRAKLRALFAAAVVR
jgi:RNA-directed DNA polymerase